MSGYDKVSPKTLWNIRRQWLSWHMTNLFAFSPWQDFFFSFFSDCNILVCRKVVSQSVSRQRRQTASLERKVKHRKLEVRENIFFTQHYLINRYEPDFVLNPMTFTYAVVCLSVRLSIWLIIDHKVITYVWICFGGSILPTASRHVPDLLPFPELVFLLLLIRAKYTSSHVKNQTRIEQDPFFLLPE